MAQAITFGLSFALTRLYGPAEFGHYSIFTGCASVAAAASTGALDRVILLGRSDREARQVATTTLLLAGITAVIVAGFGLLKGALGVLEALPLTVIDLTIYIPSFMICYAGAQIFIYSSLRQNRVRLLAGAKVVQSVTMGTVQLLASGIKGVPGLVLGSIIGWFILLVLGLRWRRSRRYLRRDLRSDSIRAVFRRHWRYPRYVMPNEALNNISNQAPIFLIGMYLSIQVAGHYGLALLMLSAPTAVMGQALGQAFLQHIGFVRSDPQALQQTMKRIWLGTALIGAVPFGAVLAFGPTIFGSAFGSKWADAGMVAQYLAPLLLVRFVSSPTSTIYLKLNMHREQWHFCVAAAMYRTTAYALIGFGAALSTAILIHVVCELIAILTYNLLALRRLRMLSSSAISAARA